MADSFGFAQVALTTVLQVIYTCPVLSDVKVQNLVPDDTEVRTEIQSRLVQTQVTSIVLANHSASARTVSIALLPTATTSALTKHTILDTYSIDAHTTEVLNYGLVLGPGNTISALASANSSIAMVVNRIEIS